MKTTVEIPDKELADAMRFTNARTKKEAINAAIAEFNLRKRMAGLARFSGKFDLLKSNEEIESMEKSE
jgi:Arc/MetJ family transcription regulator